MCLQQWCFICVDHCSGSSSNNKLLIYWLFKMYFSLCTVHLHVLFLLIFWGRCGNHSPPFEISPRRLREVWCLLSDHRKAIHFLPESNLSLTLKKVKESEVFQLCPTLCNPMDCSLSGSSIHGFFQARILEWVVISFSRRSSQSRDWTRVSSITGRCFTILATREVLDIGRLIPFN